MPLIRCNQLVIVDKSNKPLDVYTEGDDNIKIIYVKGDVVYIIYNDDKYLVVANSTFIAKGYDSDLEKILNQ